MSAYFPGMGFITRLPSTSIVVDGDYAKPPPVDTIGGDDFHVLVFETIGSNALSVVGGAIPGCRYQLLGGGGSGGTGNTSPTHGAGGSGARCKENLDFVLEAGTHDLVVGAGGASVTADLSVGNDGLTTTAFGDMADPGVGGGSGSAGLTEGKSGWNGSGGGARGTSGGTGPGGPGLNNDGGDAFPSATGTQRASGGGGGEGGDGGTAVASTRGAAGAAFNSTFRQAAEDVCPGGAGSDNALGAGNGAAATLHGGGGQGARDGNSGAGHEGRIIVLIPDIAGVTVIDS